MAFEVSASQKDQTLPMILNLRGDETIVDDFSYDSDQAMAYLGIKRSRLNQISGRELRVGRIRRDRYIRPVYREADLKDYLEWTRATATHLSSSRAIEQAVDNLDDRFNDVLQVLSEKFSQFSDQQQAWIKGELDRLPSRFKSPSSLAESLAPKAADKPYNEEKLLRKQGDTLEHVAARVHRLEEHLKAMHGLLNLFLPELKEINVSQRALRFEFGQRFDQLIEAMQNFEEQQSEALNDWKEEIDDMRVSLDALTAAEEEAQVEDLVHRPVPARHRRVVRRSYFR